MIIKPAETYSVVGWVRMPEKVNLTRTAVIKVKAKKGMAVEIKEVRIEARAIPGKPIGAPCDRDEECLSGRCERGEKYLIFQTISYGLTEGRGVCVPKEAEFAPPAEVPRARVPVELVAGAFLIFLIVIFALKSRKTKSLKRS